MRTHRMLGILALSLSLGGCAAFSQWATDNPDQSEQAAQSIENIGAAAGGAAAVAGPYGWIAAPFITAIAGIGAKLVRDANKNNQENSQ